MPLHMKQYGKTNFAQTMHENWVLKRKEKKSVTSLKTDEKQKINESNPS